MISFLPFSVHVDTADSEEGIVIMRTRTLSVVFRTLSAASVRVDGERPEALDASYNL